MPDQYDLNELCTLLDVWRYGVSLARKQALYYGHGTDNAEDDIRALLLGSLSLPHDIDPLMLQARLTCGEKQHLSTQLQERILRHVPVPYLTREAFFCGLRFYVDERVLIPRSPMAELISVQFSPWIQAHEVTRVLDLCTGSGCIGIACCYAFPDARVDAVDISSEALLVAEINKERHGLGDEFTLIESDGFASVPKTKYDIIVSNPPYVGADEMNTLPQEYLHEPRMALEATKNGLGLVEKILEHAHDYLSETGILVVEVGNSEDVLVEAYPGLPFTWLDFEHGGHGVFLLTRQQLQEYFATQT